MKPWMRTGLMTAFLAAGVAAGMGLGRAFDRSSTSAVAADRPMISGDLSAFQDALASVAEGVSPSVVHITTQVGSRGDPWESQGVGSGVIVSEKGHILTNHHVVDADPQQRQTLRVRFSDGREFPANVVGTDSETDLALLQIDPKGTSLAPIRFADSDKVRVGHLCLAIGSPFGYSHSVTFGTVSAKHRHAQLSQPYQDFIQTDAPINPGNSGGALVNIKGELIGINAAIVSPTRGSDGVGLAIASNLVKFVSDQLQKHGRVRRGYLGIRPLDFEQTQLEFGFRSMEDLLSELGLSSPRGVFVGLVESGSPADKAGLKKGDVLVEFNGEPVLGQSDMFFKVAKVNPGTTVTLKAFRDKSDREVKVALTERPPVDLGVRRR